MRIKHDTADSDPPIVGERNGRSEWGRVDVLNDR